MKNRIKCLFATIIMCMVVFNNTCAYASQKDCCNNIEEDDKVEFFDEAAEKEYTKKKIDEEVQTNTNILSNEMEQYLNEGGMFDNELYEMDGTTIEELNNCNTEDVGVFTSFYRYEEISDEEISNNEINDEEILALDTNFTELDADEINKAIAEAYYDIDISKENEQEKDSVVDNVLQALGLKAVKVYADENVDIQGANKNTYLKRTILVVPTKLGGKDYLKVQCYYEWLTMPKNRQADIMRISWDNGVFWNTELENKNTNVKVICCYTKSNYSRSQGKELSTTSHYLEQTLVSMPSDYYVENGISINGVETERELLAGHYLRSNHSLYVCYDLMDDMTRLYSINKIVDDGIEKIEVDYIKIIISVYIKPESDAENITFESYYYHTKMSQSFKIKALKYRVNNKKIDFINFLLTNFNFISFDSNIVLENLPIHWQYTFK